MSIFFRNRDGQTPIDEEMYLELMSHFKHLRNMTELYEHEEKNVAVGINWSLSNSRNHLDYLVWLELHKYMLGKIWKFAGTIRKEELNNPDFHLPLNVLPSLKVLEQDLKFWIENNTHPPKTMMAIFHERLLTIHPFKDGNGRWSRILTEFICRREKFEIPNWGLSIPNDKVRRDIYINAIKSARHQFRHEDLINIMWWTDEDQTEGTT